MSDDEGIPLPPHGRAPIGHNGAPPALLPCSWCGDATSVATLTTLGSRCDRCFAAYGRAPQSTPHLPSKEQRLANPKAWALALREREQAGERLTLAQRTAWRAAIARHDEPAPREDHAP